MPNDHQKNTNGDAHMGDTCLTQYDRRKVLLEHPLSCCANKNRILRLHGSVRQSNMPTNGDTECIGGKSLRHLTVADM